jgi:hypothetical protein
LIGLRLAPLTKQYSRDQILLEITEVPIFDCFTKPRRVNNPSPEDPALGCPKEAAKGSRQSISKQNPPSPPLQKVLQGFQWHFSQAKDYLPPFLKRLDMSSPNVGTEACPTTLLMLAFVILSEAKNLMDSGTYTLEILRLAPRNDVLGHAAEGDFAARSPSRRPPQHTHSTSMAKLYHQHSRWVL